MDSRGSDARSPRDDEGFVLIAVIVALVPVVLSVGMFVSTMQGRTSQLRTDLASERALMLAESGVDDAIYRANQLSLTHGGNYTRTLGTDESFTVEPTHLLVDGVDNDGDGLIDGADADDEDVFQIVVTGTFKDTSRRVAAYLGPTPLFPPITSAVSVHNDTVTIDINGNGIFDGNDYDLAGNLTGSQVAGLAAAPPGTVAHLTSELTSATEQNNVVGLGAAPSLGTATTIDFPTVMPALFNAAGSVLTSKTYGNGTFGTPAHPQISYKKGDVHFAGNVTGAGILVIEGDAKFTGNFRFDGIVVVLGDLDNGSGNATVYGGLLLGPGSSKLRYRGNGTVRYSSEALALAANLGGLYASFNGWQELAL